MKLQLNLTPAELAALKWAAVRAILVAPRSRRRKVPALQRALTKLENPE